MKEGSEAESSGYYTAARSRMSMRMLESGTLLNVQAFLLMVYFLPLRVIYYLVMLLTILRATTSRNEIDRTQDTTSLELHIGWHLVWASIVNPPEERSPIPYTMNDEGSYGGSCIASTVVSA